MYQAPQLVEAGLPSGTFSTADAALAAGKEVWVVPGAITSANSRGANRLLYQGALPIIDDESFADALFMTFGCLKEAKVREGVEVEIAKEVIAPEDVLLEALRAEPLGMETLRNLAASHSPKPDVLTWLVVWLATAQRDGLIAQYPDGRYGPSLHSGSRRAS